tara:strand:- start:1615 stop:2097 length:483 start_codon:yes stop_codon:yes gene_type:complete
MRHFSIIGYRSIFYFLVFLIVSHNVINTGIFINLTYLLSLLIYLYSNEKFDLSLPIVVFSVGIYQDILIGNSLGYSSSTYLFFIFLKELIKYFGLYDIKYTPFFTFAAGSFFIYLLNYIYLSVNYQTSLNIFYDIIPILVTIILFQPVNFFMKLIEKIYE